MKKIIHKAESRGSFDYGWLKTRHTFSFGNYQDRDRMNFGKLRVLNDDIVAAGKGFGSHRHENMEIVSIPLRGELAHKDSAGHEEVIKPGDIQVMSAGSGIVHSEYNHSESEEVNFLQIWIIPDGAKHGPRYDQKHFDPTGRRNEFQTIVSPQRDEALWLNQDAFFSLADLDNKINMEYSLHNSGNGVYLFVLEGKLKIEEEQLENRDGMGIWETGRFEVNSVGESRILLIEVPMG